MTYDRYYYTMLSPVEKVAYRTLYYGLMNFERGVVFSNCVEDSLERVVSSVNYDNPHLFYVRFDRYRIESSAFDCKCIFDYYFTKREVNILNSSVKSTLRTIARTVRKGRDYDTEVALHDMLAGYVKYDAGERLITSHPEYSCTILGVLLQKCAICEGIAKAVKYLLNCLDIKCIVARGALLDSPNIGHAWNIAKLNGEAVHLDVTNDLRGDDGVVRHTFLNLSDSQIMLSHRKDQGYPPCNTQKYDYFCVNGLRVFGKSDLQRLIEYACGRGERGVEFRVQQLKISEERIAQCAYEALLGNSLSTNIRLSCAIHKEQGAIYLSW